MRINLSISSSNFTLLVGVLLTVACSYPKNLWKESSEKVSPMKVESVSGNVTQIPSPNSVSVIHFWAINQPIAKSSLPIIQQLSDTLKSVDGVVVQSVCLNWAATKASVSETVSNYTFPTGLDSSGEISKTLSITTVPQTWIIDKKGNAEAIFMGKREDVSMVDVLYKRTLSVLQK